MIGSLRKATADQRLFLCGLVRTYDMACIGEIPMQHFLDVTLEEWLTRWPLVPGLVDCGVLPPAALGGVLSETQQALVDAERATVYMVSFPMVDLTSPVTQWLTIGWGSS